MDATDLLDDATLSPQQRAVVVAAFEAAWAEIKSRFESEEGRRHARTKLAGIVRLLARQDIVDCQHLTDPASAGFGGRSDGLFPNDNTRSSRKGRSRLWFSFGQGSEQ